MNHLAGSRTERNLLTAFAAESQARARYQLYAAVAKKEGLRQIHRIFEETADHERVHAKMFFRQLEGRPVEISATFPAGDVGDTATNLIRAAAGEAEEWAELYPEYARVAKAEGFKKIAALFTAVAAAERFHEGRFRALAERLISGFFEREEPTRWICRKCGFVHEGREAATRCPACAHPQGHFEVLGEPF